MERINLRGMTACLSHSALAAGTTTTTTTAALVVSIKGLTTSVSAATNGATPTTDAATGAAFTPVTTGNGTVYVVAYAGSTRQLYQGSVEGLDAGGNFNKLPKFPDMPDTTCPVGFVTIRNTGSAWAPGTTWAQSNLNASFVSVAALPTRPSAG